MNFSITSDKEIKVLHIEFVDTPTGGGINGSIQSVETPEVSRPTLTKSTKSSPKKKLDYESMYSNYDESKDTEIVSNGARAEDVVIPDTSYREGKVADTMNKDF